LIQLATGLLKRLGNSVKLSEGREAQAAFQQTECGPKGETQRQQGSQQKDRNKAGAKAIHREHRSLTVAAP
jgi:hypothetical protein